MRHFFAAAAVGSALVVCGCVNPRPVGIDGKVPGGKSPPADVVPAAKPSANKADAELAPALASQACLKTAEELDARGFPGEAAAHYERARQLDPKAAPVAAKLAVLYARGGDDARAAAEFDKALATAPTDPDLLNDAGCFHQGRGDLAAAEVHFTRATRAKPDHARAWANLAVVYAKAGRVDESRKAFARVLTPAQAEYNLGVLLAGAGRTDDAKACFRAAQTLDPQFAPAADALRRLDSPVAAVR